MKTLVITSSNQSGLACGYAAWNKLRLSAEYISLDYGQELPDLSDVEKLYILGYSLTEKHLEELSNKKISIVIIDDKNIKKYINFINQKVTEKEDTDSKEINLVNFDLIGDLGTSIFDFIVNEEKSSIRSCWEHFNPGYDLPKVLKYIEDRHLWKFEYIESRNLYYGLISQSVNNNYYWWHTLCISENLLNFILQKGNTISEYMDVTNRDFVLNENNFNYRYLDGKKIAMFTYTTDISYLSKEIFKLKEDVDVVLGIKLISNNKIRCELRSRKDTIDVGELARRFGGGGKTNTAGIILSSESCYYAFF